MKNINRVKEINKNLVNNDNTMKSFKEQLLKYEYGLINPCQPLVISSNSKMLGYTKINDLPITINISTIKKIKDKHNLNLDFLINLEELLCDSVLSFQSLQYEDTLIVVTDRFNEENNPIICSLRKDKKNLWFNVNEINSVYDKKNLEMMIIKSYEKGCEFYRNEKTEQYVVSSGFCLTQELRTALSISILPHILDNVNQTTERRTLTDRITNAKNNKTQNTNEKILTKDINKER